MNKIMVMVGASGSGKSTLAKKIAEKTGAVIVSSDAIREEITGAVEDQSKNGEVFCIFHRRLHDYIAEGKDVIADATSLTPTYRQQILETVEDIPCKKEAIVVLKSYEECMKDNVDRKHPVPDGVIERQFKSFQMPCLEEGFDCITVVNHSSWRVA